MGLTYGIAADGYRARLCGPWTKEKLVYLRKYASAFMVAMAPKREAGKWESLVFMDLLAGPGLAIERDRGTEFPGSALIALDTSPPFDRLYLGDLSHENVRALRARIPAADQHRVDIRPGDCNVRAREVVDELSRRTLALAFVDPEGFEVRFEMLRALSLRRIDVLLLFPSGIGIARNLRKFATRQDSPMDWFWGNRDWRRTAVARAVSGGKVEPAELDEMLDHSWVRAFRERMTRVGFEHQDGSDPCFRNDQNAPMYHLLFFSKDVAGLRIWRNIKRIDARGQRGLLLEDGA